MTICIRGARMTDVGAQALVHKPDDRVKRIVAAWHRSETCHQFTSEELFIKAVRRNRKTLASSDTVRRFFTEVNFRFSTRTKDTQETLYFKDHATQQTGRLRQQHSKGPLARIDKEAKTRLFLSGERYRRVKRSHKQCKCRVPEFYPRELRPADGRRHIEFVCRGKKLSHWHRSRGTVGRSRKDLKRRISAALKNILGT